MYHRLAIPGKIQICLYLTFTEFIEPFLKRSLIINRIDGAPINPDLKGLVSKSDGHNKPDTIEILHLVG